jgi:hypothetical protein
MREAWGSLLGYGARKNQLIWAVPSGHFEHLSPVETIASRLAARITSCLPTIHQGCVASVHNVLHGL